MEEIDSDKYLISNIDELREEAEKVKETFLLQKDKINDLFELTKTLTDINKKLYDLNEENRAVYHKYSKEYNLKEKYEKIGKYYKK